MLTRTDWCAIFCFIGFIFCFFFLEESNYSRATIAGQESQISSGTQTPIEPVKNTSATDKALEADEKHTAASSTSAEEGLGSLTTPTKTFVQKLRLFELGVFSKPIMLPRMMLRPLIFLTFPVIFYSGFSYGSNLVWFNVLNGTASLILGGPPYNFKASMVGLSYLSPLIGVFIGAAYTGKFGDWFILKWSRTRGRGIYEPEYRLWLFSVSLLLIPFGLILWGVGAAHVSIEA